MEDYILREIDRIGELLQHVARKLGLLKDDVPSYSLTDVQTEFDNVEIPWTLDEVLAHDNPILYLVEEHNISEKGLELFVEILFHTDLDESRKQAILKDAISYLEGKGYFSFKLYSLC